MRPNPQEIADLVTFTEEIVNGKIDLLCSVLRKYLHDPLVRAALPNASAHFDTPTVVCTFKNPTVSRIFTFLKLFKIF